MTKRKDTSKNNGFRIQVKLRKDTHNTLTAEAERLDMTVNQLCRRILREEAINIDDRNRSKARQTR